MKIIHNTTALQHVLTDLGDYLNSIVIYTLDEAHSLHLASTDKEQLAMKESTGAVPIIDRAVLRTTGDPNINALIDIADHADRVLDEIQNGE